MSEESNLEKPEAKTLRPAGVFSASGFAFA